jgi:hypothetical protein
VAPVVTVPAPVVEQPAVVGQPVIGQPAVAGESPVAGKPGQIVPPSPPVAGRQLVGGLRSEGVYYADGTQAAAIDALRRSGRQEALFIFRVAREGEGNFPAGNAAAVAREAPPAAAEPSPPAKAPAAKSD